MLAGCEAPSVTRAAQNGSTTATIGLTVTPCPIDLEAGEGATVVFTLTARELSAGITSVRVSGTTPAGVSPACSVTTPDSGTARDGSWRCTWVLNGYAEPGGWTARAIVLDSVGGRDTLETTLPVANALGDTTPPVLTGLVFLEVRDTTGGIDTRALVVAGVDSAAGMWRVEIGGVQDDPILDWTCSAVVGLWPEGPASPGTWSPQAEYSPGCPMLLVEGTAPLYWTIRDVRLIDLRGNERLYDDLALQQAGFITQIDVSK